MDEHKFNPRRAILCGVLFALLIQFFIWLWMESARPSSTPFFILMAATTHCGWGLHSLFGWPKDPDTLGHLFVNIVYWSALFSLISWLRFKWRRRGAADEPLCDACGYNLTGNTSGICSECGTVIKLEEVSPLEAGPRR